MSQGLSPIASGGDGATVRARLNAALQRLQSKASGTSRPSDIAAGESWIETDNPGGGVWALWLYDGSHDILDAIIDSNTGDMWRVSGQIVSLVTGAVATGTTQLPHDDTIPQNTEGDQYMSLAITPRRSDSKLDISVLWNGSGSVVAPITVALFQDSTANALAAVPAVVVNAAGSQPIPLNHTMTSGTTSSTTFKVRAGLRDAGTTTFNGHTGARTMGGVMASSIIIREVLQ